MSFDTTSYILGHAKGKADATGTVIVEGGITCSDPNNDGNVIITEDEEDNG